MAADPGRQPWTPLVLGAIAVVFVAYRVGIGGHLPGAFPALACDAGPIQHLLVAPDAALRALAACDAATVGRRVWLDTFVVVPGMVVLLLLAARALGRDHPTALRLGAQATPFLAGLAALVENGAALGLLAGAATPGDAAGVAMGLGAARIKWAAIALGTTSLAMGLVRQRRHAVAALACGPAALGAVAAFAGAMLGRADLLAFGANSAWVGLGALALVGATSGGWAPEAAWPRRLVATGMGALPIALPILLLLDLPFAGDDARRVGALVPAAVALGAVVGAWAWRRILAVRPGETPGHVRMLLAATAVGLALVPEVPDLPHPGWILRAATCVLAGIAWGCGEYGVPGPGTRWHALLQRVGGAFVLATLPSLEQALGPWVLTGVAQLHVLVGLPLAPPTWMLEGTRLHGTVERLTLLPWAWVAALHARSAIRYYAAPPARRPYEPDDAAWIAGSRAARGVPADAPVLGLALTGGGVRSTAFSGGVLAAMRARGLLERVDVLSLVSGGAWSGIGWWLQAKAPDAPVPVDRWAQNADYMGLTAAKGRRGAFRLARLVVANLLLLLATVFGGGLWLANAVLIAALVSLDPAVPGVVLPTWLVEAPVSGWLLAPVPVSGSALLARGAGLVAWLVLANALWAAPSFFAPSAIGRALRPLGLLLSLWGILTGTRLAGLAPLGFLFAMAVEWRVRRGGRTTGGARTRGSAMGVLLVVAVALAGELGVPGAARAADALGGLVVGVLAWAVRWVTADGQGVDGLYAILLVAPALLALVVALRGGPSRASTSLHDEWAGAIRDAFLGPEADAPLADAFGVRPDHRPLVIVGACVNVPNTTDPALARRHTTALEVGPTGVGGPTIGWARTQRYPLSLAEVVALSSAAAGSQMGGETDRTLATALAASNLQLGRWVSAPRYVGRHGTPDGWVPGLLAEVSWDGEERDPDLFVTDGGHHDNSGVLALVRRGCGHVVLVDADADTYTDGWPWHGQLRELLGRLQAEEGYQLDDARPYGPEGPGEAAGLDALLQDPAWITGHPTATLALRLTHGRRPPLHLLVVRLARPALLPEAALPFAPDSAFPAWPSSDQAWSPARFRAVAALGDPHGDTVRAWAEERGLVPARPAVAM